MGKRFAMIMPDELDEMVRQAIEANRTVKRKSESQAALDRAVEIAYADNEIQLAAALLVLMSARVAIRQGAALQCLMQFAVDERAAGRWGPPL